MLLTSWYQIPLLDCETKLKEYCLEIYKEEIKLVAISKDLYVIVLGFYADDVNFESPVLISNMGFEEYEDFLAIKESIVEMSTKFNIYLPMPDLKKGEVFITNDLHQYLKDIIFKQFILGDIGND